MENDDFVNLVRETARKAAIEAMAAAQEQAESNRGLTRDDVMAAFREVMAPPSDPNAARDDENLPTPSIDAADLKRRGWGDGNALQDIISGKLRITDAERE